MGKEGEKKGKGENGLVREWRNEGMDGGAERLTPRHWLSHILLQFPPPQLPHPPAHNILSRTTGVYAYISSHKYFQGIDANLFLEKDTESHYT